MDTAPWSDLICRAVDSVSNGVAITNAQQPDNPIIYVNPAFERITGYRSEEVVHQNCRFLQGKDRRSQPELNRLKEAVQHGQECCITIQNFRKDGTMFWNELYVAPIYSLEGHLTHFIGIQNDITTQKEAQEALYRREKDLHTVVESMVDDLMILNKEGKIIFVNPATERIFNRRSAELLESSLGIPITVNSRAEINIQRSGKSPLGVDFACSRVLWQGSSAYLLSLREITERRQVYDPLTRLPTRILFDERLQHVINLSQRQNDFCFALLFIDLDRFKVINDSLGHTSGDQLLMQFALRIQEQLRACDMLARLSGDEFAVLLEGLNYLDDAIKVAERINTALAQPFELEGHEVFTSASIGIALGRATLEHPRDLIREADTAMYRAKAKGGANYAIFDKEMHAQAVMRLQLETDLRHAINCQELVVYYQPIIALSSNKLLGLEALLRWYHPNRGEISPEQFIPVAEETGLIIPIGQYVLSQACQQAQDWLEQGLLPAAFKISVNLSSKQLSNPDLVDQILQTLEKTGLPSHHLQLEITESSLMENPITAASIFRELEAHSIRLAMDDFGTGYSSLNYLRRFPIHTLKIDRSFTYRLGTQDEDLEIVQSIVSLARNLKINVIAEGIETEVQLGCLQTIGCDLGQGFLFAKALDSQATFDFLQQHSLEPA
ncbi:MAG: EAL domain-containing protein [Leptolyngbyaceae cyanobacterium]